MTSIYSKNGMNPRPRFRCGGFLGRSSGPLPAQAAGKEDLRGFRPPPRIAPIHIAPAGAGHAERHVAPPSANHEAIELHAGGYFPRSLFVPAGSEEVALPEVRQVMPGNGRSVTNRSRRKSRMSVSAASLPLGSSHAWPKGPHEPSPRMREERPISWEPDAESHCTPTGREHHRKRT